MATDKPLLTMTFLIVFIGFFVARRASWGTFCQRMPARYKTVQYGTTAVTRITFCTCDGVHR
jgi:hypothetical protein